MPSPSVVYQLDFIIKSSFTLIAENVFLQQNKCDYGAKYYPEFRQYFDRKKAEGKNGMLVLNAIKNKLVLRVVAVVNKQQPYVDNTKIAA